MIPNALIMGSTKCGTTALARFLDAHPQVCMSESKELRYLTDKDHGAYLPNAKNYHNSGWEGYSSYFKHCKDARVYFEATPNYMYHKTPLEALSTRSEVLLLFILRKPSDRIWSVFTYWQNNVGTIPPEMTFSEYVDLALTQPAPILKGKGRQVEYIIDHSKFINYLRPYLEKFPREQLEICLMEDLKKDPLSVILPIANKLGIDADFYSDYEFKAVAETFAIKNHFLHHIVSGTVRAFPWHARTKVIPNLPKPVKNLYRRLNTSAKPSKSEEDLAALARLDAVFEEANKELAEACQLDLSAWQTS